MDIPSSGTGRCIVRVTGHTPARVGFLLTCALAACTWGDPSIHLLAGTGETVAAASPAARRVRQTIAARPLRFEARGEVDGSRRFDAHGLGYGLQVSPGGARLALATPGGAQRLLTLQIAGARAGGPLEGEEPLEGLVHRYVGAPSHWRAGGATYARVTARDVHPGIDVTYYGTQEQLEYDFVVAAGADPADAGLVINGADAVAIDAQGDLVLHLGTRTLRQRRPVAYQVADGRRVAVSARFRYDAASHRLGFDVGADNRTLPLVIDPVLVYSSWFGGVSAEEFVSVAVDADGFIYTLGVASADGGYPTTPGAFQPAKPGPLNTTDYVVTKFNPAGTAVVYSTYLGGTADDYSNSFNLPGALAVDSAGRVHIAGETKSTDFPVTAGAAKPTFGGGTFDAVYVRLSADGSLGYGSYLGGTDNDQAFGVAVDGTGAAYLVGGTNSSVAEQFPVTANAYSGTLSGLRDVFVARFSATGALTYCSYFGGSSSEATVSGDIEVDQAGRIAFASDTSSANLPVTGTARQGTYGGGSSDGFLARIDTSVSGPAGLLYSTFIGGSVGEAVYGVARGTTGRIFVAGETSSANFPTSPGAYDVTFNTGGFALDGFVASYDLSLTGASSRIYSTLLGGNDRESLFDIAVDTLGRAHVVGQSRATDFPLVQPVDSHRSANLNLFEAIVSILDPTGSALVFSTYLSPESNGSALQAVAVNSNGETYVAGVTNASTPQSTSAPNGFPLVNAVQTTYGGGGKDAVLQKLGVSVDLGLTKSANPLVVLPGQPVTFTLAVTNPAGDAASGVVVTDTLPAGLEFVSCTSSHSGLCGGSGNARSITFTSLAAGTTATIQVVARMLAVTPGQVIFNSAAVIAGVLDPVLANNTATASVSVPTLEPSGDADGDGLSNGFETTYGLDPFGGAGSGANDDPDSDGRTNLQEQLDGTHPRGFVITYLAEGATGDFFDTRLAIANPGATSALVLTRFQRGDGTTIRDYRVVPPMSRTTIDAETIPGLEAAEFATLVEADVQVVVDRTMTWDGTGYGSHAERGILTRSATKWYFAEGATFGNFNLFYLIQNPNADAATVKVTYLLPTPAPPLVKTYVVGPQARFNIWVDNEGLTDPTLAPLANAELSAIIESTNGVPIIAERAMYLDQPGRPLGAGHESAGVTAPSTTWFLAEGATGSYFDLFILIANPGPSAANVTAEYLLAGGQVITKTYDVAGNSRFNIWVDLEDAALANAAVSTRLTSTNGVPIIVERSMWWPGPTAATWQEAHNSPGETVTGTRWAMAEGESGGARETETYVLVANTSALPGVIRATVLFEDGTAPATRDFAVPGRSRFNVVPASDFPVVAGKRYGMLIESIGGAPAQIVVERAMYSNSGGVHWAAGTNALATRLP